MAEDGVDLGAPVVTEQLTRAEVQELYDKLANGDAVDWDRVVGQ